ncbi:hypothetical protein B0H15DRAFT_31719 [Mycena belliarum]|uniref:F-box domain-containing protein n=1 Tax=Mycena belliarum TaxID=1033014 RepID=A0AAD6UDW0_9AGAR|nr:hypothetical protein B0H15DRAFT_31719 [Mycena belliae]
MLLTDSRQSLTDVDAPFTEHPHGSEELVLEPRTTDRLAVDKATNCPVLTLPPEIACEIFLDLVESQNSGSSSPSSAPLILLKVCRTWRLIALAAPFLWNRVRFALVPPADEESSESAAGLSDNWIQSLRAIPGPSTHGCSIYPCMLEPATAIDVFRPAPSQPMARDIVLD